MSFLRYRLWSPNSYTLRVAGNKNFFRISVRGRNRASIFDVLIEQPILAEIDDGGDVDAIHDDSDPQGI